MADDDDDLYDSVTGMADRLGLKGRERRRYIHEHMTRGGYDAVPQYVKRDDDDDDDDDDRSPFFGRGRPRRRDRDDDDRDSDRSRGNRRRSAGDGWYE